MERRLFLKTTCSLCLGIASGALESCASLPIYETTTSGNSVNVPISLFADKDIVIVRADRLPYDIALQKMPEGNYVALYLQCTHSDNPLATTGQGFTCSLHGSTFDKTGRVTKGPATVPLRRLRTEQVSENVVVRFD